LDTVSPIRAGCESNWNGVCRIVIHYRQHIQPLWDKLRPNANATRDFMCSSCHSQTNPVMTATAGTCEFRTNNDTGIRVPCGQLELVNTDDANEPDHVIAYRQLLFAHNAQELNANMSALQDICLQRDPMTGVCIQFQVVTPSMLALNARGSRFFAKMSSNAGTVDHSSLLTDAEKRLISEWLDIGAQYFNDPFLAPEN
jgi:hypothetical protein